MMKSYIMALDQGTTSSRAIIFDHAGRAAAIAQEEFTQYYPKPGWVEHDPKEIWFCQRSVAEKAIAQAGIGPQQIAAIGITNQRETTVVWDRETGEPVYPAIVWQCRRTADMIDALEPEFCDYIKKTTGLVPDPYFSATKLKWILDHVEGAREKSAGGKASFWNDRYMADLESYRREGICHRLYKCFPDDAF